MKVKVAISNRHVHLTKETYIKLFKNDNIEEKFKLNQIGEFASNSKISVENNGKIIENVRVVGPFRNYDQIELLESDLKYLGIDVKERKSGNLNDTPGINLIYENNVVKVNFGVIKAERHIHINSKDKKDFTDDEIVLVKGPKCYFTAKIKISDTGFYELHIDKDESILYDLNNGDEVEFERINDEYNILCNYGEVLINEDLSKYTTYKVGGNTKYLILPSSTDNLIKLIKYLKNTNIPYFILGNGSNLIISEGFYNGVIIRLTSLTNFSVKDNILTTDAGVYLPLLSNKLAKEGYSGFEWACGLPGTIGGSIYGNAEAYKTAISDNLIDVTVLDNDEVKIIKKEDINFGYRTSNFKSNNEIILSARFKLEKKDSNKLLELIKERNKKRMENQPINFPSGGSVFRNIDANLYMDEVIKYNLPVNNGIISAWYLIENVGLRGYKIGGAMISEKHANFIINTGNAKSSDIIELMNLIKKKVKDKYNINLISEQEIFNLEGGNMYYFIGIKGSGMSALAQIMKKLGYEVSGSDVDKHFFTQVGLEELNIPFYPYNKDNIKEGMIIVKGESIKDDNEELIRAKELNLTIYSYVEMVGELTKKYHTITIAGCHGKTTTTSMIAHIFNNLIGCNYLIGDGTGFANKNNEYFALEACEYKRHFLNYEKDIAIITNIDLDHVDYYKDIDDVIDAYQSYIENTKKIVIACGDDPYTGKLKSNKIKYYGLNDNYDIYAANIEYNENGTSFDIVIDNNVYGHFDIPIYGKHLLLDAIAVISACYYSNLDSKDVNNEFKTFKGANRRFSETFINDNIVIDDYAHHPNEVKALIEAINQKYPNKKIIGIFQPHTYSRTKEFTNDFIEIFKNLYKIYILKIHEAREKQEDFPGITSDNIINMLENGYPITKENAADVIEEGNFIYVIMSPNDLSIMKDLIIDKLKKLH